MTSEDIKDQHENKNAGHLTSSIVGKITELEMLNIKKDVKINLLNAIINVIETIKLTMED